MNEAGTESLERMFLINTALILISFFKEQGVENAIICSNKTHGFLNIPHLILYDRSNLIPAFRKSFQNPG